MSEKPMTTGSPALDAPAPNRPETTDNESPGAAAGPAEQYDARKSIEQRVEEVLRAVNPLLAAARPLLRALADTPESLRQDQADRWKSLLAQEARDFQTVCERANIRREHIMAARFCLCTALDEAANRTEWGKNTWANNSLLIQFHGETGGGEKVFQLLGRLVEAPAEHLDVIEVIYQVLSLGFEGRYAGPTGSHRQLDEIRQRLLHMISGARESVPRELSPHWQAAEPGRLGHLRAIPMWVTISVLSLALFAQFAWYKYQLLRRTHDLEQQILAIGKNAAPPLRPQSPNTPRLAVLLKEEIARGVVSVQEDATRSAVTFRGDDMFDGGRADVSSRILPLLDKVAGEINKVPGKVTVIGHSDNVPIRTAAFPSNQVLSEERAATVSEYLASKGVAKGRLEAVGKGDAEPLADNATPAGRAKNRRVEIVVTQSAE